MMIPFGALEKDRAGVDTGLLTIAKNCYPSTIGWGPMPTLAEYGSGALPAACKGLFFAREKSGGYQVFAATVTKIYKLVSGVWTDYSRTTGGAYATGAGNFWQAAQYDSKLILVNGSDAPQVIDVDAGATNFANLGGSPPVARYVWVINDFVFLADANNRRRFLCSGFNSPAQWTVGTNLCDEFILADGGNIASPGHLGAFGLILQDGGMARRLIYIEGDPTTAWRLEPIEGVKGSIGGYSTVSANGRIFYLAEDGIYSLGTDGANVPVGAQRINKAFLESCDPARIDQTQGFADPFSTRVYWAYYSSSAATVFDRLLGYDWQLDRLFFVEQSAAVWAGIVVPGVSLEQLATTYPNLDTMPVSLDSRQFAGGRPTMAAVTSGGKLAMLSGANATATLRIAGVHLVPGMRAILQEVYPVGEWGGATLSLNVGKREHSGKPVTWAGPFSLNPEVGAFYPRASSRIHDLELVISGDGWTFAQSLQTTEKPDGRR